PFVPASLGYPTTWIKAEAPLTAVSIIAALHRGDIFISESPSGPQVVAERTADAIQGVVVGAEGDALLAIDQTGIVGALAIRDSSHRFKLPVIAESIYIRLEIHRATGGVRALTNAYWRDPAPV
ncbi:MAG: hypothetical protein WKF81_13525, partial [Thermomicrobiales bacterium]